MLGLMCSSSHFTFHIGVSHPCVLTEESVVAVSSESAANTTGKSSCPCVETHDWLSMQGCCTVKSEVCGGVWRAAGTSRLTSVITQLDIKNP